MPIEDLLATLPEALLSENAAPLTPSSVEEEDDNDESVFYTCLYYNLFNYILPCLVTLHH